MRKKNKNKLQKILHCDWFHMNSNCLYEVTKLWKRDVERNKVASYIDNNIIEIIIIPNNIIEKY